MDYIGEYDPQRVKFLQCQDVEDEQEERVRALYDIMHKELYEFFRSELMEKLLPRCSCGANTYCRCE